MMIKKILLLSTVLAVSACGGNSSSPNAKPSGYTNPTGYVGNGGGAVGKVSSLMDFSEVDTIKNAKAKPKSSPNTSSLGVFSIVSGNGTTLYTNAATTITKKYYTDNRLSQEVSSTANTSGMDIGWDETDSNFLVKANVKQRTGQKGLQILMDICNTTVDDKDCSKLKKAAKNNQKVASLKSEGGSFDGTNYTINSRKYQIVDAASMGGNIYFDVKSGALQSNNKNIASNKYQVFIDTLGKSGSNIEIFGTDLIGYKSNMGLDSDKDGYSKSKDGKTEYRTDFIVINSLRSANGVAQYVNISDIYMYTTKRDVTTKVEDNTDATYYHFKSIVQGDGTKDISKVGAKYSQNGGFNVLGMVGKNYSVKSKNAKLVGDVNIAIDTNTKTITEFKVDNIKQYTTTANTQEFTTVHKDLGEDFKDMYSAKNIKISNTGDFKATLLEKNGVKGKSDTWEVNVAGGFFGKNAEEVAGAVVMKRNVEEANNNNIGGHFIAKKQ